MAQERINTGENLVEYKSISLVSAEVAQRLGLETEVPIFISQQQIRKNLCKECDHAFGPLVYQAGYETEAHHFHLNRYGGVYFRAHRPPIFPVHGSWFALLKPQTVTVSDGESDLGEIRRAERVLVNEIKAFCHNNAGEEINEGLICSSRGSYRFDLLPVCHKDFRQSEYEAKYQFKIFEGFVQFSQS